MQIDVVAVIPADEQYRRMLAVWEACEAASVPVPRRVTEYFAGAETRPSAIGRELAVGRVDLEAGTAEWAKVEYGSGLEVSLRSLPAGTTALQLRPVAKDPAAPG